MSFSIEELYVKYLEHPTICTDSRRIDEHSLFFALKGESFDGNEYAAQAIEDGSAFAVVDSEEKANGDQYILVDNVLESLQELARYHREHLNIPVICITGTNGKTTTKELLTSVLSKKFSVTSTRGNFNNHIGVPLSILSISKDTEMAVIELGANHVGEIEFLCGIAKPSHGIITNIGKAHLEGFGDLDGVKKAKSELYQYLKSEGGTVFINADNDLLMDLAKGMDAIFYGSSGDNYCKGALINADGHLKISYKLRDGDEHQVESHLIGAYNFENLMAAICIGSFFEVADTDIAKALLTYVPDNSRSQEIDTERNHIIMDAYNANPMNMRAALENFSNQGKLNSMVILGDMLELGDYAKEEHQQVVEYLRARAFDRVVLVGDQFSEVVGMLKCSHFRNVEEAKIGFQSSPPSEMNILIKGSRGIGLEALLAVL